ncbi:MAG: PAS domain-containing protein [Verrucomicrobia bacterium]|nr:PAS domain-containing protein [Verrucomicrobiota bacterium]
MDPKTKSWPLKILEPFTETAAKQRVLLIEDSRVDAQVIRNMIDQAAHSVFHLEEVETLSGGLQRLEHGGIELVLLDLSLPDSPKDQTFTKLHSAVSHLPIIILSGIDDQDFANQKVQEGAQDYLIKGQFDARLLLRSMRYAIKRKRAEIALAQERELLRALLHNIPDRIYFKDEKSRFIRINPALTAHFKLSDPHAAIGKTDFDFFTVEHAQAAYEDEQRILRTGHPVVGIIEKETHPDGRVTWAFTSKMPLRNKHGQIVGTFGVSRDITDIVMKEEQLKRANAELTRKSEEILKVLADLKSSNKELKNTQAHLIQAAKLESVGTLAAGVAHEVKNPLQTILMGVDYLTENFATGHETVTLVLDEMREAIKRADSIVRGLLEFSSVNQPNASEEDLNRVVEKSIGLVHYQLTKSRIQIVTDLDPAVPRLSLDRIKMEQVFINLFMNAIQAMANGGTLTVRTRLIRFEEAQLLTGPAARHFKIGDGAVLVEVNDTGPGIPEELLPKIFDPFFTTKPTGKGTGLGLPVTKKIIELHSGVIDVRNLPGSGGVRVTILFRLPP